MTAMSRNPTLEAAPISPAISGRDLLGQISMTSATPRDHSPPMPRAARKRSTPRCQGAWANPHRPEKTE